METKYLSTPVLRIAYEERGDPTDPPIILLHGFPDDIRAWDEIVQPLVAAGYRTLTPYLRGYGPTRFLSEITFRSGQQAALGQDVIDFANALGLKRFLLVGHDWGALAADVAAALYPERVERLITVALGYAIYNPTVQASPAPFEQMRALWYQWYFQLESGAIALRTRRAELCEFLWRTWSPTWNFLPQTFEKTAASFDNPDFVDVVLHMYRHRRNTASGDPRYDELEARLKHFPSIAVPTTVLQGADDGAALPDFTANQERFYPFSYARIVVPGAGHFLHREQPEVVIRALLEQHF